MNLWIFGYGSLCWRPGFEYNDVVIGYIKGFSRKFWQGNVTHRGTIGQPGRVATLVEQDNSEVWGCAFEITGEAALKYLMNRECKQGGYMTKFTTFYPREGSNRSPVPLTVMFYMAVPKNDLWLGDAPLDEIAHQITECSGASGHNVEYLLRLVEFMREQIPEAADEELFTLEDLVRSRIKQKNINLSELMTTDIHVLKQRSNEDMDNSRQAPRENTFQFVSRVPQKNLRCLNI